jgi:RHS repeat-associated protein
MSYCAGLAITKTAGTDKRHQRGAKVGAFAPEEKIKNSRELTLAGFVPPTAVPALTYDGTNRLTSRAGTPLSYDANGNLTGFGSATYTWNARNQLSATSGGAATFGYDALGRRVSATVSGITTPYLYDGQNPAMISSNQMLAGAGLDEIYAQINSTGTTSYVRDGLNSTVALTNSAGATTANYAYSPYGDGVGSGTTTTPLQYTGRENDGATGLYYYRARYYSPQVGRFISEDPLGLGGGVNYYAYVSGNPLSFRDPEGKELIAAGVGIAIGAIWGIANGYIEGDRGWGELTADGLAGGLTGGLAGLTNGGSVLAGLLAKSAASAGIEGLRQVANDAISGCVKETNYKKMLFAAAGSIVGDGIGKFAGAAASESWGAFNHTAEEPVELVERLVGGNLEGLTDLSLSIAEFIRHHP